MGGWSRTSPPEEGNESGYKLDALWSNMVNVYDHVTVTKSRQMMLAAGEAR